MLKDILTDKVDKLWEECQDRNIGSNEAELDFKSSIVDLMISEKPLKQNNIKNYFVYLLIFFASFVAWLCIFSFVLLELNYANLADFQEGVITWFYLCTSITLIATIYNINKEC